MRPVTACLVDTVERHRRGRRAARRRDRARRALLIVADYDADGATACAVGMRGPCARWARTVDFLVPNRFEFGYGLTPEIVALAARSALPTSSSPSTTASPASKASRRAARTASTSSITDHHLPGEQLPDYRMDRQSESAGLRVSEQAPGRRRRHVLCADGAARRCCASAGISRAGETQARPRCSTWSRSERSQTSSGSITSIASSSTQGLRRIRAGRMQPGVSALFAAARRDPAHATTYDLGFVAGPRLNAAGRLADMSIGIACLLTDDEATGAMRWQRTRPSQSRTARRRGDDAGQATRAMQGHRRRGPARIACIVPTGIRASSASSPRASRTVIHRPTIVFARAGTASCAARLAPSPAFICAMRSTSSPSARPARSLASAVTPSPPGCRCARTRSRALSRSSSGSRSEWLSPPPWTGRSRPTASLPAHELTLPLRGVDGKACGAKVSARRCSTTISAVEDQRVVGEQHGRLTLGLGPRRLEAIAFQSIQAPSPPESGPRTAPRSSLSGSFWLAARRRAWQPA